MDWDKFGVKSCCFYMSLRTGTKIFGFISLLASLVSGTFVVHMIARTLGDGGPSDLTIVDLIAQIVQMITSVLLLLAAYQEKPMFIPPWIVSTIANALLEAFILPSLILRFGGGYYNTFDGWITWIIFTTVDDIYGLIVVSSFYVRLLYGREENSVT